MPHSKRRCYAHYLRTQQGFTTSSYMSFHLHLGVGNQGVHAQYAPCGAQSCGTRQFPAVLHDASSAAAFETARLTATIAADRSASILSLLVMISFLDEIRVDCLSVRATTSPPAIAKLLWQISETLHSLNVAFNLQLIFGSARNLHVRAPRLDPREATSLSER